MVRRRIEIPEELYEELEKDAKQLRIGVNTLGVSLLANAVKEARERSARPFKSDPASCTHSWVDIRDQDGKIQCQWCGTILSRVE